MIWVCHGSSKNRLQNASKSIHPNPPGNPKSSQRRTRYPNAQHPHLYIYVYIIDTYINIYIYTHLNLLLAVIHGLLLF